MTAALKIYNSFANDWSPEQLAALDKIDRWRRNCASGFRTLGGFAGTGKSTLVAYLAEEWPTAAVCALTGKAANVLRNKGVARAQTIHSLIYAPFEDENGKVKFRKRPFIEERAIIVDEASMVGRYLHNDLMSFMVPILYVGDHGQLEPIGDGKDGFHLMASPEMRLEKIHRQAADNPILRMATAFREGRESGVWSAMRSGWKEKTGRLRLLGRYEALRNLAGQVICGMNKTRHAVNAKVRERMKFSGSIPNAGETLLCLQNNQEWQVFNGQQMEVVQTGRHGRFLDLTIRTEDDRVLTVPCLPEQFGKNKVEDHKDRSVVLLDYGYALTCHKAQGSEYAEVTVIEELCSLWDAKRWRYTAVTRAAERLVYCV